MATASALPLFHLYGDPPDDQAFDFIHVETIALRSSAHDWLIRAHRHRNLFQILLIERGGGEMTFEAASLDFAAPAAILVPPTTAHGFRFHPEVTDGWVVSFTEDVAEALGERSGEATDPNQEYSMARVLIGTSAWHYESWRGWPWPVSVTRTCLPNLSANSSAHSMSR